MAANWSLGQVLAQLDSGRKWTGGTISYAFPTTSSGLFSQGEAAGFRAVNATQQALMVLAMATWDDLIPQGFAAGTPGATNIEFGYTSTSIGYAHAYFPTNGSIYFNANEASLVTTSVGEYGFQTYIHEIGHALGLNHMGNYNGDGNWSPGSYQDSVVLSVMSYFGPRSAAPNYSPEVMQADWIGPDNRIHSPQTPMVNDVMAIQSMYGTSTTTRTGDTIYGFGSNAGGATGRLYDFAVNPYPVLTIFDSGGFDTLDLSGWNSASQVDLRPGAYSSANEMTNNIAIAFGTVIEAAVGGGGNDELTGNAADNRLVGNAGNDRLYGLDGDDVLVGGPGDDLLDGGAGTDTAIFAGAFAGYDITVSGNSATLVSVAEGTDRTLAIELFRFSDGLRTLAELAGSVTVDPAPEGTADDYPYGTDTPGVVLLGGAPTHGRIEVGGDRDLFRLTLVAGQTYAFSLDRTTGGLTDPYLTLWSSGLDLLAQDDDSGGNGNAHIGFTARTSGTYYLGVQDYRGDGTGGYTLRATMADAEPPTVIGLSPADGAVAVSVDADLRLDFSENVSIGSGSIRLYGDNGALLREIRATDASLVRVSGSTVTIDPGPNLPAGTGFTVLVDPDSFRDAAGNAFGGINSVTAWNFRTAAVGSGDDFPLSVSTTGRVVVNGAPTSGRIDHVDDGDLFQVALQAGVTYQFDMVGAPGGRLDPFLALFGTLPEVDLIGYDDDSGPRPLDSRLYFTPSEAGTYYLAAYDYAEATGRYTVSAIAPADDYLGSTGTRGRVAIGASAITGRVEVPSDIDMFAVDLVAGQQYTFELWSPAGGGGLEDPYLVLLDGHGTPLEVDDDTGINLDALLTYTAAYSGIHYLAAMDYDVGTGRYAIEGYGRNVIRGTAGRDDLQGATMHDTLDGGASNDTLRGGPGDDILIGGAGIDLGIYAGVVGQYYLENMGDGWVVSDLQGGEGRDLVYGVERLSFDDGGWALDLDGAAGVVAKILGAVFGPESVYNEAYVGIGLNLLDGGMTVPTLTQLALDARLGERARPTQVVDLLYQNLFGARPDAATQKFYVDLITSGTYSQAGLAWAAAETEWNLDNIDLVGLAQTGLGYVA